MSRSRSAPGSQGPAVQARGWGWRHWGRDAWAVRGLDLVIEPGERVLLLGASGAGKSTLLQGLAGVLGGPDEGEQEGALLVGGSPPEQARGEIGLVLQDPDSQVILPRIGDDVAFGCENLGVPRQEIWRRVDAALDSVGLELGRDHPTNALSGGQKQRLALAGVLAMQPRVLLLDEPTANLDPDGVREVRQAVGRVLEETGATLVVIEHRVAVWRDLVDRVIVLAPGGGLLADGPPSEVLADHAGSLAAQGVWVPGQSPIVPRRTRAAEAVELLGARGLAIGRARDQVVADGIELELRAGEALAVTGANGSGTSTLGLTLGGLLAPLAGEVEAPGLAGGIDPRPIRWRSRELVSRIGTVFQDPAHQFVTATVRDELALGPRTLGLDAAAVAARIDPLVERLRLGALLDANPFTLSGGEQRRLSVATALTTRPPVLILDEPTFGQDARTWRELVAFLAELLDEGSAIVAITHDEDIVTALADQELRSRRAAGEPATFELVP